MSNVPTHTLSTTVARRVRDCLDRLVCTRPKAADPSSTTFIFPARVAEMRVLIMKTGSYSEDGMPLVANLELDCQLIRHATWFHLRDEHGTSITRSETVPRGVIHLHAIRIDRPTLVRHFTHRRGQSRLVLESHERVGEYFDGYSLLSHEEYFDLARERGYPARSIEFE